MKFDLSNPKTFDSDYFLKLAITCRHNALVLKDSANLAFQNNHSKNHALFLLHTSFEELQKGIFCMFVHRGFMSSSQIELIFIKHEAKIILFEKIFENPTFSMKKNQFYLDGVLQTTQGTLVSAVSTTNYPLSIGVNPGATYANFFDGRIDEVRVYNRALSANEVNRLYNMGR